MQRPAGLAALGAVALAALYAALALRSPPSLGFFGDDAVYASTARALAEGRGYRHLSIPGEPLQTKYPPLHPALLALVLRAGAQLPEDQAWLRLPGALAGALAVALAALYWRRVLGADARLCAAVAALAALSPVLLTYLRVTMSELAYALLATAALLCLDGPAARGGTRARTAWLLLGAALAAGAALTRALGLSLALAAVAAPLLRRRFGDALLVAAVLLALLGPWWSWQASAALENGALARGFLTAFELGYADYLPGDPSEALRVAGQNLLRLCFGLGYFQLALPLSWVRSAIERGGAWLVLLHAFCHGTLALAAWGFWRSAREGFRTLHLYAAVYGAVVLVWAFSPYRFLVPWTPFLLYFAAQGARDALGLALRRPRAVLAAGSLLWAGVLGLFLAEDWKLATSRERAFYARELSIDWSELRDVERFLRERTAPEDVIASAHPEALFLATGRRGHYFWPDTDPVAFGYAPQRAASRFTILPVAAESQARADQMRANLGRVYGEAGIDWYVEWGVLPAAQAMARVVAEQPAWFEPVHVTPGRAFRIFRVRLPESAAR
jgi:hypothetical protein